MLKVGLTGNIGSGKTLVGEMFRILDIPVFKADAEAKNLYSRPEIKKQLKQITGKSIFDDHGEVDRHKMAALIFADKKLLENVNALIHPLVRESFSLYSKRFAEKPYVIYEAAIIIESGYYKQLDRIILVQAPEGLRFQRVVGRDGATLEEIKRRAASQMPEEKKMKFADWIIYNDGIQMVIPQVLKIDLELRKLTQP